MWYITPDCYHCFDFFFQGWLPLADLTMDAEVNNSVDQHVQYIDNGAKTCIIANSTNLTN
jgi:hypothetical protein